MHLLEVVVNELVVRIILLSTKTSKRHARFLPLTTASKPTRAFGREEDADTERDRERDSKADDDPPRSIGIITRVVADTVVDDVRNQNTDGDHELVRCDDRATNLARAAFGLEHGYTDGQNTNAQTSHNTANHQVDPRVHGGNLDDIANDENGNTNRQTASATKPIGSVGSSKSTN